MKGWRKFRLGDGCITNANSYTPKEKWKFVNYLDTGNITDNKINAIQYIDIKNKNFQAEQEEKFKKIVLFTRLFAQNKGILVLSKINPITFLFLRVLL